MISPAEVRHLRHQFFRSARVYDESLRETARQSAADGRASYATIENPTTHDIYRYLAEYVGAVAQQQTGREPKDIKILDWGGGKGYVTYFLQQQGFDVTLYETASFPHRDFWKKFELKTKTSDGPTLPFEDGEFDMVVGFGVLEHVPYEYDALKEVNRVLKNDGLFLCFNLPNRFGYLHHVAAKRGVKYHDRLYTSRETRWLLKRSGFNTVGKPWRRQLFPKNSLTYKHPAAWEWLDLQLCRYTPLGLFATSLEFVARKQYTYTSPH